MASFIKFLLILLPVNSCYILNHNINIYKKNYNNKIIKIYEPKNIIKPNLKCLLFLTGANSFIPADIYSNFITSLVDYKYSVSVLPNDLEASYQYIRSVQNEYSSIIPIAHSTGSVNAINLANNFKNIEKAIFLDPVDNSKLFNIFNNIQNENLLNLKNLLIITAEKSYKWSLDPLIIPFIPIFRLNMKKLLSVKSDLNIEYIKSEDHGHCDVLDPLWGDLMHGTIAKGVDNREYKNIELYYIWLCEEIHNFINKYENENNYSPCSFEDSIENIY